MPIYEYECDNCGDRIELIQRMGDPPQTECPSCRTHALRKLVSAAGFRLKGTGWYETDFKTQPKKTKESQQEPKDSTTKETPVSDAKKDSKTVSSSESS